MDPAGVDVELPSILGVRHNLVYRSFFFFFRIASKTVALYAFNVDWLTSHRCTASIGTT